MNEKLDEIRRAQYNMEKDINKRKVLKGTRYLLLRNGADIFDKEYKTRLDNALRHEQTALTGLPSQRATQRDMDAAQ